MFYRISSPIGSPAQKVMRQGKGTADHLLPLGYWLMVIYLNITGLQSNSNSQNADCRGPNGTETTGSYCIHFNSVRVEMILVAVVHYGYKVYEIDPFDS